MKTELEEVAKNFIPKSNKWTIKDIFIDGANWMQEQDKNKYSEKEVLVKLYECLGHFAYEHNIVINGNEIDKWFEQFKKK
jgi:hypothetical protein